MYDTTNNACTMYIQTYMYVSMYVCINCILVSNVRMYTNFPYIVSSYLCMYALIILYLFHGSTSDNCVITSSCRSRIYLWVK